MAMFRVLLPVLVVLVAVFASPVKERSFSVYETAEIIASNGYPSETHHVTTSDGYILEMHRIPHGRNQSPSGKRPVVFLMHGLLAASNSYIILGPEFAPAYNLADGGFDIWMGNARGNKNSRFHVRLNPDSILQKRDFFDFSYEEIAIHDLPAMMDYVLQYTGQEKLHYIGHSQGGTTFLILNSMRPEYNEKIASAHLLAGVGYQNHFPNEQLAGVARFTDVIYNTAVLSGIVEIFPPESTGRSQGGQKANQCTGDAELSYMCELIGVNHLLNANARLDLESSPFDEYEAAGAALKQIAHYGQNIRDKSFRRWSYGSVQNLIQYGSRNPPVYDLSRITINVTMHYTVNDNLLDERDVIAMANVMPNTSVRKVARDTFLHEDFVAAFDAKELVTDYIIETLKRDSGLLKDSVPVDNYQEIEHRSIGNEDNFAFNANVEGSVVVEAVIETTATDSSNNIILNSILYFYLIVLSFFLLII